jgi:DNA polymerase-3 subunit delta
MTPRLYLLHGPDEFAAAEFLAALKDKLGDPALAALNTTIFDGRSVTLAELRVVCDALPFLTPRRLVVVEGWLTRLLSRASAAGEPEADGEADAEDTPRATSGGSAREIMASLVAYAPQMPESTALVLVEPRDLPPGNVVLKAAAQAEWGLVKQFPLVKGEALARWVRARAKAAGGEFSRAAAEALAEVDDDPRALGNEIQKLLAYVDYARPVEIEDVQALTTVGSEAVIFDLVDALGQQRGPQAMRLLHNLLETQDPFYILTMIVRQYRLLLQARELLDARAGEGEVAAALKLSPYPAGKVCSQARNFTLDGLERIYRRLLEYDVSIKTGQIEAGAALDTLVGALTA